MNNDRIIKLLDELKSHLEMSQGNDLKSLMDKSSQDAAKVGVENPMDEEAMTDMDGKPKDLSIAKVEVMPGEESEEGPKEAKDLMPGEEEMTSEEIEELLKNLK